MRNDSESKQALESALLDIVAEEAMVDRASLIPSARLEDLDIASADFVMILMAIEEKYGAYISVDNELADLETVQDLLTLAAKKIAEDQGVKDTDHKDTGHKDTGA
jgi:acyl carrier protein